MEVKTSDSTKLFKVFDASKRKKSRKRRDGQEDNQSIATDESTSFVTVPIGRTASAEASLQNVKRTADGHSKRRDMDSSPDVAGGSPEDDRRTVRSARKHRRPNREGISLALKAGMTSSPRSLSPRHAGDTTIDTIPHDQDSIIYTFLEEAIKKDKKQRHARRTEERDRDSHERRSPERHGHLRHSHNHHGHSHECDPSRSRDRDHKHHHRRRRDDRSPHERKHRKESSPEPSINQVSLLETFAKLCTQMNEITLNSNTPEKTVQRSQSHKSLQCEVDPKIEIQSKPNDGLLRVRSRENCRENNTPRIRSQENLYKEKSRHDQERKSVDPCRCCCKNEIEYSKVDVRDTRYCSKADVRLPTYCSKAELRNNYDTRNPQQCSKVDVRNPQYCSKVNVRNAQYLSKVDVRNHPYCSKLDVRSRVPERYREYPAEAGITPSRLGMIPAGDPFREAMYRDNYKDYDDRIRHERIFEEDDGRNYDQKTSRSYNVRRDGYVDDDRICKRTVRSDTNKEKRYDILRDPRFESRSPQKYYEDRRYSPEKDKRSMRKSIDNRFERASLASKDDDYKERERDSGLSIADGENSTISGRSHYMRAVKQEIIEQREAMDKMMKLWKELMRCFKGISSQGQNDKNVKENADNVHDTAAAQLKLWRECMRRYETVARDVGDTDARLMEEINKQRSEMAEMASMWQECLQRYRDMSNDFNNLKQQVSKPPPPPEISSHLAVPPLICAEGEGASPMPPYRLPANYPPAPPQPGYVSGGSPLRYRASAPPAAWWWEQPPREREWQSPRRRGSPDSRGSRDKDRRHRHKERDHGTRYREKSSKASAHSEHKHRKR